jgi:hypothetical protein
MTKPPRQPSPAARRWCEDAVSHLETATPNFAVIVRLDRTIQYAAAFAFQPQRLRLLDTRFRWRDERCGRGERCRHDKQTIDGELK